MNKYLVLLLVTLFAMSVHSQSISNDTVVLQPSDTTRTSLVQLSKNDTLQRDVNVLENLDISTPDSIPNDSILADSISPPQQNDMLDADVHYKAKDSIVFYSDGVGFLYGEGEVKYLTPRPIELKAEYIRINMDSSTLEAVGGVDSIGDVYGEPVFKEGQEEYSSKYMTYNFKTKKGYIKGGVTQQGEGYIVANETKKIGEDELYMRGGKYTTCDHHDHPHFYLQLTKARVKPNSYIAAGPAYMVMADVPLPLAVPFGFFPFTSKYSSGIIMPSFGDEFERGFFLKEGGYYFAISDYFDLEVTGDIYTKGTWALALSSKYKWRYHFSGSFMASYREDVRGEKDTPGYSKSKNFKVNWRHQQDPKANLYNTFSASVDFATSGYNQSNVNNYYNPAEQSKNITSSSISYTQRFPESPWSISVNASLQQRTQDSTISLTLPSLNIAMSRVYPFKRKKALGKERFYEKIAVSYTMSFSNSINTKESMFLKSNFLRDWKNGIKHSLPISASFNLFKYITLSPSINYTDRWYFSRIDKDWDMAAQEEVQDTTYGFYRVYDFNVALSASTKLYGFYTPYRKWFGDKVDKIRHVITPTVSFSYHPDFGDPLFKFYDTYQKVMVDKQNINKVRTEDVTYSPYQHGMYGVPGRGMSGNINFTIKNNLEMKIRDRKDTVDNKYKKVSLIDDFTVGWGYNLAADSLNWNMISASIRLKIVDNFSINLSGQFDPYMYKINESGNPVRCNELRWDHGQAPRFRGTGTSFGYTFNNNTFKPKDDKDDKDDDPIAQSGEDDIGNADEDGRQKREEDDKDKDKKTEMDGEGYAKLTIPWSLSLNYSLNWRESMRKEDFDYEKMAYKRKFTHNFTFSGSVSPTPKWNITFSGSVDLTEWKITQTSLSVMRDLHCWKLSASISPVGLYKSFIVTIGVNASMLQDLKYEKRSDPSSAVDFF